MASKSITALKADNNSIITTNGARAITGAILNSLLADILDSSVNRITDAAILGLNDFDSSQTYPEGRAVIYDDGGGNQVYRANVANGPAAFNPAEWDNLSPVINIFNNDGTLSGNRVLSGADLYSLTLGSSGGGELTDFSMYINEGATSLQLRTSNGWLINASDSNSQSAINIKQGSLEMFHTLQAGGDSGNVYGIYSDDNTKGGQFKSFNTSNSASYVAITSHINNGVVINDIKNGLGLSLNDRAVDEANRVWSTDDNWIPSVGAIKANVGASITNDYIPIGNATNDGIEDSFIEIVQSVDWGSGNTGNRTIRLNADDSGFPSGNNVIRFGLNANDTDNIAEIFLSNGDFNGVAWGKDGAYRSGTSETGNGKFYVENNGFEILSATRTGTFNDAFTIDARNFNIKDSDVLGGGSYFQAFGGAFNDTLKPLVVNSDGGPVPFMVRAIKSSAGAGEDFYALTTKNLTGANNLGVVISYTDFSSGINQQGIDGSLSHLVINCSSDFNTDGFTKDYSTDASSIFNAPHIWMRDKIQDTKLIRDGHLAHCSDDTVKFRVGGVTKTIGKPNSNTQASTATLTPDADSEDLETVTALAVNLTIAAPTGTPVDGQKLVIKIKDDGTSRTLTWNAIFQVIGTTLPTATTISKWHRIELEYNTTDTKWDVVDVKEQV